MCFTIFMMLAIVIILLCETVGLWFLNTQMVIPEERMSAANWVYQFSVFSCVASLIVTPYNATIIAHERMNVYAYVGMLEVVLKLVVVYLLLVIPADRLSTYGFLLLLSQVVVTVTYIAYCLKHFSESRYKFYWGKSASQQPKYILILIQLYFAKRL